MGVNMDQKYIAEFIASYHYTMSWLTTDDEGEPLEIGPETIEQDDRFFEQCAECHDFVEGMEKTLLTAFDEHDYTADQAGHDFALTRNGHGAGFWDRDLGDIGEMLTEYCKPYGESYLYFGDDGKLYYG